MQKGTISLLTSPWSHTGWKHHVIASTLGCVAISSLLLLAACGDSGSKSSGAEDVPVREVSTIYDLGACTPDREGDTVYVTAQSIDYLCSGNNWLDITTLPENPDPAQSSSSVVPGNDPESSSSTVDDPLNGGSSSSARTSYIEVPTKEQLGTCDASLMGLRTLVLADSSYFTCKANGWAKDDTYLGYDIVPTKEDLPQCHAGNAKQRVLDKKDSVFFKCDSVKWVPETADGYIVKNASILGAAQKGPFKFDSPLTLREVLLHDDALTYTGREYIDEISSNKGDFVIPKVNLVYPYAVLEVRGLWRNEVTGEWSKDSMTLRALTDLTSRTEVNINLLTHLEYDRAVQLVNKGYSVFAAKKQAEYEIMTAFGFATTVEYSEDLKTFVPSTSENYGENATLMAISLLFIGDRSEAEILKAIADFKQDMASDGEWNDAQTKADMADWAEAFDGGSIRANVKSWNILDIPSYENELTVFWNNAYELGGCSSTRSGVIAQNKNSKSKNYNVHYICKGTSWQKATDIEKDTYEWADGEEGEVRTGRVNENKYYVYENGAWRASVSEIENNLGACVTSRLSEVSKFGNEYYTCKTSGWVTATALEYDTYQWSAGTDGEVKSGSVISSNHYTYADGTWRATANDVEYEFGACVASRSNEKHIQNGKYYICENKAWKLLTAEEYGLGYCSATNDGVVENLNDVYYICKSGSWDVATVLEYDTYGKTCSENGAIVGGEVVSTNKYVCDAGVFRLANEIELSLNKGCVSYTENDKIRRHISEEQDSVYTCKNNVWEGAVEDFVPDGYVLDRRDHQMYKTVTIGTQTWMAENLNYSDTINYPGMKGRTWCYKYSLDSCAKYGRLYTWAAAMDSAGTFSTNGKKCGYKSTCSPTYPVRGICPEGWHLPTEVEINTLFTAVGGESAAGKMLRSQMGWKAYNNITNEDAYGFSALPAGLRYYDGYFIYVGNRAYFWIATQSSDDYAYDMVLYYSDDRARLYDDDKLNGISVRCLQD